MTHDNNHPNSIQEARMSTNHQQVLSRDLTSEQVSQVVDALHVK
jgi:hypothetical protein